jgi:hypothetical protein
VKINLFSNVTTVLGGIGTTLIGLLALDETLQTWPTILIVVGAYAAASGLHGLRR